MKINIHLTPLLLVLLFLLPGCRNEDPIAEQNTKAPKPDTTKNEANGASGDSASLQNLLKQYDPPGRDVWQKPEVVIGKMGDLSSKTVADIGAGSGFFSRRLAQQAKKVIAVDIDPRFIHFMDSIKRVELKPEYQGRFETRLGQPDDPKLKPNEADIVLVVNTYIYIQDRVAYLKNLLNMLPTGGQVIIVDFKKKRMPIKYPTADVRMELYEVENELDAAGFSKIQSDDCALDYQYIVMATK
ncbi:MAG: class I SAM-dependent methyltransferase [Saprospiraceae bacterium]|nr:class I SAM-dependent methyltransferase [Saprospiraceae bacterium]